MSDEPELFIVDPSDWPDAAEWRERREREKATARAHYRDLVVAEIGRLEAVGDPAGRAEALFDLLFDHRYDDGRECACSCHPRLPTGDLHDFGFDCPCGQSAEERRQSRRRWLDDLDDYWKSPEGLAATARREAEEAELAVWIADQDGVDVASHGGFAPEQWYGNVEGRRFYFRERHGQWRIELDLRPSGRFARVWIGGDLNDEAAFEQREIDVGDVIAEGTTGDPGYGNTPIERAQFIVTIIRDHLRRTACALHTSGLDDLTRRLGVEPTFCPACGTKLT